MNVSLTTFGMAVTDDHVLTHGFGKDQLVTAVHADGQLTPGDLGDDHGDRNRMISSDALSILYYTIGTVGFLGNALVVLVVMGTSMRKEITNMYITSQSMIDSVIAALIILQTVFQDNRQTLSDSLGDVLLCRLWLNKSPLWAMIICSIWNLVVLTFERYMGIVHPIKHKVMYTSRKVVTSVVVVVVVCVVIHFSYKVPPTGVEGGKCKSLAFWPSALAPKVASFCMIIVNFLAPLLIITGLYTRMYLSLRTRVTPGTNPTSGTTTTTGGTSAQKPAPRNAGMERAKRNLLNTLLIVVVCFFLCWICNQIYFLLFNIGYQVVSFQSPFYHFTVVSVFCNCCCNPLIYMIKYKKFQVGVKEFGRKRLGLNLNRYSSQVDPKTVSTST